MTLWPRLRANARMACVGAILGGTGACHAADGPERDVTSFYAAKFAGDLTVLLRSLTPADSAAMARYSGTDPELLERDLGYLPAGYPGISMDSMRVTRHGRDTAEVQAFLTMPNWDRAGGRFVRDTLAMRTTDRATDAGLVNSLPKIHEQRSTRWVRTPRGWRLALGLERIAVAREAKRRMEDLRSPLRDRASAASEFLHRIAGTQWDTRVMRARADDVIVAAPLADSVEIIVRPYQYLDIGLHLDIANHSSRSLRMVAGVVVDADGARHEEVLYEVPARGIKQGTTGPAYPLPPRAVIITDIDVTNGGKV